MAGLSVRNVTIGGWTVTTPRSWKKFEPASVGGFDPEGNTPLNWPLSGLFTTSVTDVVTTRP